MGGEGRRFLVGAAYFWLGDSMRSPRGDNTCCLLMLFLASGFVTYCKAFRQKRNDIIPCDYAFHSDGVPGDAAPVCHAQPHFISPVSNSNLEEFRRRLLEQWLSH